MVVGDLSQQKYITSWQLIVLAESRTKCFAGFEQGLGLIVGKGYS